jgi:hypothetical protein
MSLISYTLEEVTDIIKQGLADTSNRQTKDVDVYNVQNISGTSYTYDASVYFREDTEKDASDTFKTLVETQVETFKGNLLNKVRDKVRTKKQGVIPDNELETYLETNVSLTVDNQSGRFTQSFNKGKARPDFDAIIPTIEMGATDITTEDYLEIKDVVCVKSDTNVTVSFGLTTNMPGERLDYRVRLSSAGMVKDGSAGFEEWVTTTSTQGINNKIDNYTTPTSVSDKVLTRWYSTLDQSNDFVPGNSYRVHIQVFFPSEPSFKVYHSVLV